MILIGSSSRFTAEELPRQTPEQFIATHLFQSFFFQSNNPNAYSQMLIRQFQDGFRANTPKLPSIHVGSISDNCMAGLVAIVEEKDFVRKWDGSIVPGIPYGAAALINLRYLDSSTTHIIPDHDSLRVEINVPYSQRSNPPLAAALRAAGSSVSC
jgi:hypothetical protein